MAGYKSRLEKDLDAWIEGGLIPASSRTPILASVTEAPRLGASAALAAIGGLLLGAAVIAFVAANWGAIPRIARFVLVLGLFLSVAGGAAWAGKTRPLARNIVLLVASLIYAAAIGLTGQIFDIAGDPRAALHAAGLAALFLALAGQSSGAAVAALALTALGDIEGVDILFGTHTSLPWLALGAPAGAALAWAWRSKPLAHAAAAALWAAGVLTLLDLHLSSASTAEACLFAAGVYAAAALSTRWMAYSRVDRASFDQGWWGKVARRAADWSGGLPAIGYGWWSWAALAFFGAAGIDHAVMPAPAHRVLWLALAAGAVALGLQDRRSSVTAAGVVAMAGAIGAIIFDLGLGLMAAAGVFAAVAVAALAGGWVLRQRGAA